MTNFKRVRSKKKPPDDDDTGLAMMKQHETPTTVATKQVTSNYNLLASNNHRIIPIITNVRRRQSNKNNKMTIRTRSSASSSSQLQKLTINIVNASLKQKLVLLLLFFTLFLIFISSSLLAHVANSPVAQAEAIYHIAPQNKQQVSISNGTISTQLLNSGSSNQHPTRQELSRYVQLGGKPNHHSSIHQQLKHGTTTTINQNSDLSNNRQPTTTSSDSNSNNQQQQQQQKRPEKLCMGTSNRLSKTSNQTEHYQSLVDRYRNCTYVSGNLEITWLDEGLDLTFLESIREVTGYLLIAYVNVQKISMPNLQIIRGRELFKINNEKEEFAMFLMNNDLKALELPNLREILEGSFSSYNNKNLCHIRTINWEEILNRPYYKPLISYNVTVPECPPCDASCEAPSCWGEGPEMCQKFSKVNCASQCSQGRCFGSLPRECCHIHCAGGCTGPKQTDCMACKYFDNDGECIKECPSMTFYDPTKFSVEPNPNGRYAYGSTCVKECPPHLLRDREACVKSCPQNKRNVNGECVPCIGPCPKNCQAVDIVHSGNIDQLINCTEIEGDIRILETSFKGFHIFSQNNTVSTLIEPMHPSRLKVFETVKTITGFLDIQAYHENFTDLSCFKNLEVIGGRSMAELFYTLSIIKTSLVSLNMHNLRKVNTGKIKIEENSRLCYVDTINWDSLNLTRPEDITVRNNGHQSECREKNRHCHNQCTRDGCWGSGPDECLACKNYKLDSYCVKNCSSIKLPNEPGHVIAFEASGNNRTCKRCHQECAGGCSGTESSDCWQCKRVKDGPYCVAECPTSKYNQNGICKDCHDSCLGGCTGPSNKLGLGGCNSCGKPVITTHRTTATGTTTMQSANAGKINGSMIIASHPTYEQNNHNQSPYCIRQEEPCPEGFYQEYVGRSVCRKCHHRCKSCTGMGTHVSVCECAKYTAGEQCEDACPRDYFADEQRRRCNKCSPECNGCFGPTEADCITCRRYRIYYDQIGSRSMLTIEDQSSSSASVGAIKLPGNRFNCTAQCPSDKPHRISEVNMLDPYCSENAGQELDNPVVSMSSTYTSLVVILSAIAACFFVYKCRLEKQKDKTVKKLTMTLSGIDDIEPLTPSRLQPNLSTIQSIKETELRQGRLLGEGVGGKVYQGTWHPENIEYLKKGGKHLKDGIPVAIKVLRYTSQSKNKEFLNEAYNMASVNHPNVVRLMAICMTPEQLMLVTPLMPLGCLLEYVKVHKNEICAKNLLEWCKQIAKGMEYLESLRMVHRDLALRNVLLQTCGRALISDFGLAKLLEHDQNEYQVFGRPRLPIKWLAPECIREHKFTHKSDVWAFGVTVWELLTFGERPFEKYDVQQPDISNIILTAIQKGERLHQPTHMSVDVYKVLYSCWSYYPEDRPSFKALAQDFANFARDPERFLAIKGIDHLGPIKQQHTTESVPSLNGNNLWRPSLSACSTGQLSMGDADYMSADEPLTGHNEMNSHLLEPPMSAQPDLHPKSHTHRFNGKFQYPGNDLMDVGGREMLYDKDNYLLPSPHSAETRFSNTLLASNSTRDPPHSAGLIGISNPQYFMTVGNNERANGSQHNQSHRSGQNASTGHIPVHHMPTSLV